MLAMHRDSMGLHLRLLCAGAAAPRPCQHSTQTRWWTQMIMLVAVNKRQAQKQTLHAHCSSKYRGLCLESVLRPRSSHLT